MRSTTTSRVFSTIVAALTITNITSAADFNELMKFIPEGANAIVTLNVEKAYGSAYAKQEGWDQVKAQASGSAPLKLPPDAKHVVLATQMDFEYMRPVWEVAAFELGIDPSMDFVAKRTKGTVDHIAGQEAIETPNDSIVVKFEPNIFGVMRPASRQRASRWVKEVTSRGGNSLSPYLKEASVYPDRVGTEIIMALDLQDVLREKDVLHALSGSPLLKKEGADVEAVAKTISSARGVTLGIRVTDRVFGSVKVDFSGDTKSIAKFAKPLLLEILGEAGASIDEFHEWKPVVKSNRVSLQGTLTSSGLLRVFSILQHDSSKVDDDPEKLAGGSQASDQMTDEEKVPYATKQYYDGVNKYLRDLSREKGATSYGQMGLWFQKYAKRIDRLPILNVDKDMVNFGAWTAEQLRNGLEAIQGVGIRSKAREAQVYNEFSGYASWGTNAGPVARYGWGGGYRMYGSGYGNATWDVRNVDAERRSIRYEEKAKGSTQAREIIKEITNAQQDVRRSMTEKYKIEF